LPAKVVGAFFSNWLLVVLCRRKGMGGLALGIRNDLNTAVRGGLISRAGFNKIQDAF
jgi:hypothetical protein